MKVVEKIFQIAISDCDLKLHNFSSRFKLNMDSFKMNYLHSNYHLYQDDEIKEFLFQHFNKDILEAYCKLKPYAFKADLARYCLLFEFGGVYSDLSYLHINPIVVNDKSGLVVFRDIVRGHPSWAVSNALIYADKGRKEIERVINVIVGNVRRNFYGESPLDISGPYCFGRVLSDFSNYREVTYGFSGEFSPNYRSFGNIYKSMPDKTVIALRNKNYGEQIVNHGIDGTNDYSSMWKLGLVY